MRPPPGGRAWHPGHVSAPRIAARVGTALLAVGLAAGCGGAGTTNATRSDASATTTTTTTAATTTSGSTTSRPDATPPPHRRHRRAPAPGTLPQTSALPSASHPHLPRRDGRPVARRSHRLRPRGPRPAFFPEAAYAQLKADRRSPRRLAGPPRRRLRGSTSAPPTRCSAPDAAQAQLGHGPGVRRRTPTGSRRASVTTPSATTRCPMPASSTAARREIRSFGIASMISWRGVWYVVHLGAVLRPSAARCGRRCGGRGPGVSVVLVDLLSRRLRGRLAGGRMNRFCGNEASPSHRHAGRSGGAPPSRSLAPAARAKSRNHRGPRDLSSRAAAWPACPPRSGPALPARPPRHTRGTAVRSQPTSCRAGPTGCAAGGAARWRRRRRTASTTAETATMAMII